MDIGGAVLLVIVVVAWLIWTVSYYGKRRDVETATNRLNAAITAFDSAPGIAAAKRAAQGAVLRELAAARRVMGETEGIRAVSARMAEIDALLRAEEAKPQPADQLPSDVEVERQARQKVAYGMVGKGVSAEDKAAFKRDMTEFAAADPLVHDIAARAAQVAERHPGILQSKIYPFFPDHDPERVRYALYFAHELGMIYRKKKGNTYQIFPAGNVVEGSAVPMKGDA